MAALLCVVLAVIALSQVNGQVPMPQPFNGSNPLIPTGQGLGYSVSLIYRPALDVIRSERCNREITVQGMAKRVDVSRNPTVSAHEVRVPPQIEISGPPTNGLFTLVIGNQPEMETFYGTPTKPFVNWLKSDIQMSGSGGLAPASFLPIIPGFQDNAFVFVGLYQQSAPVLNNASISSYVDKECPFSADYTHRCSFDVLGYAADNSFTLAFAGYFVVRPDHYSAMVLSQFPIVENACFWLDKYDMISNALIGEKAFDLELGVMAKFVTTEEMLGPVCGRVFHYKEDKVEVTAMTGKPVPARKTRTIPWVWYHKMDDNEAWKEDWYTLAYVSQVTDWPQGGSPHKPLLLWLVTNIHGGDVSNGKCDVPYLAAMPSSGVQTEAFLLFKQTKKVEINAADYSESDCSLQYRCSFNIAKMAQDNHLNLVGAQTFQVAADPHAIVKIHKAGYLSEAEACTLLLPFKDEGKMLGQCLPKFTSWIDLWEKMQKSEDHEEKKGMMEKMKEMCPELAEDFSKDKPYDMEEMKEKVEDKMDKMKDWMKEKIEEKMGEEKKYFMHMLMKKMFGEMDDKDDKSGEGYDKDDKKDCGMEMMEMMMKMKEGMDMMEGNWEDKEKELGPCMMAVAMKLKKLHMEYVKKQKMEYMKEKFEMFMKEKMHEFVKHMILKKMADHLGIDCKGDEKEENPCEDPKKVKMMLWKKYVTMKEKKKGMGEDDMGSVEKMEKYKSSEEMGDEWDKKMKMMEEIKNQMKEIFFFKSIMSMMKEKMAEKKGYDKEGDALPALKDFIKGDPGWKRFCDDL